MKRFFSEIVNWIKQVASLIWLFISKAISTCKVFCKRAIKILVQGISLVVAFWRKLQVWTKKTIYILGIITVLTATYTFVTGNTSINDIKINGFWGNLKEAFSTKKIPKASNDELRKIAYPYIFDESTMFLFQKPDIKNVPLYLGPGTEFPIAGNGNVYCDFSLAYINYIANDGNWALIEYPTTMIEEEGNRLNVGGWVDGYIDGKVLDQLLKREDQKVIQPQNLPVLHLSSTPLYNNTFIRDEQNIIMYVPENTISKFLFSYVSPYDTLGYIETETDQGKIRAFTSLKYLGLIEE